MAERGTATALTAPRSTAISQVTPSGMAASALVHARLDAIGPRRRVGTEADEGDLAGHLGVVDEAHGRFLAGLDARPPRFADRADREHRIGIDDLAISVPTCTAWPTCTGTRSTLPSIGARMATLVELGLGRGQRRLGRRDRRLPAPPGCCAAGCRCR